MMQRLGTILLLGTYLLISLKVIFHVHVCDKAGVKVQLYTATEMSCCAAKAAEQAGCCELAQTCERPTEGPSCCASAQIELSLDQPQQLTKAFELVPCPAETLAPLSPTPSHAADPVAPATWPIDPPPPKVARWRSHCATLTYG